MTEFTPEMLAQFGSATPFVIMLIWYFQKVRPSEIAERKERDAEHKAERETLRAVIERQHTEGQSLQRETNTILAGLTESIKDSMRTRRDEQ